MHNSPLPVPVVVISQPMFFPWVGLFEQIKLSQIFVHYDDVHFSKGSFFNRVQIKTPRDPGFKWLTVPLQQMKLDTNINHTFIQNMEDWQQSHLDFLKQTYAQAPYKSDMLQLVNSVYQKPHHDLASLSIDSIETVCQYFGLHQGRQFIRSSALNIPGKSTQRVLDIVKHFQGKTYVTGHGAIQYFDHDLLEQNQIAIEYMNYQKLPYPQLHGPFTPFVSILDLIANCGQAGINNICSGTMNWKDYKLNHQKSA